MKKLRNILSLAVMGMIAVICLSSCNRRYIFAPEKPNVPFFKQKGESKVSGNIGAFSLNIQGAYALSNHLAATATINLDIGLEKNNQVETYNSGNNLSISYSRNSFAMGMGTFGLVNSSHTVSLNLYTGIGGGNVGIFEIYSQNIDFNRFYKVNTFKFFLQPSINLMFDKMVNLAFYFKPTYVHYGKYSTNYSQTELIAYGFDKIHNNLILYPEIGYDMQVKFPGISWLYMENSFSIAFRTGDLWGTYLYPHYVNISFGLTAHLGQ